MIKYLSILFLACFAVMTTAQRSYQADNFSQEGSKWVDSVLMEMSLDEKIGQMMMIRAHSDKGQAHINAVESLIKKYNIGSLCFFQGTPEKQLELTNDYQKISKIPLLVAMDAEWGLGMRHKENAQSFPRQLMLGATRNNHSIYQMGREIGRQLRAIGVHLNFAPVVDVNNNIDNPVINDRSFGENRELVAEKGISYMDGLQDAGIIACAKHFPGHGDTDVDSHKALPLINHNRERLDSIELYPFKRLIQQGVGAMMIAHLNVPTLDPKGRPTTLSPEVTTDLLQKDMGFDGLVITDAMEMKGVTSSYPSGKAEALAIIAGNDILCLPSNVSKAISTIKEYIKSGKISEERINKSVRKILASKYRLGLTGFQKLPSSNLEKAIFSKEGEAIKRNLIEQSITVVRNEDDLIPIGNIVDVNFASLAFGEQNITPFQNRMSDYTRMVHFTSKKYPSDNEMDQLKDQMKDFDKVVISFHDMSKYSSRSFGVLERSIELAREIDKSTDVIVVLFGSPYALKYFDDFEHVIVSYNEDELTQDITAQGIFGAFSFQGRLPVTASEKSRQGTGLVTSNLFRLGWGAAEQVGMDSDTLALIDELAEKMIKNGATPGCQILVARNGRIVHHKAYGHMTYDRKTPVFINDIYDLASVTKVAATTVSLMSLQDRELIDVRQPLGKYYSLSKDYNKGNMKIRDILSHTAGLKSWIPFYKETLDNKNLPSPEYYRSTKTENFGIHVANRLWLKNTYRDKILKEIMISPVGRKGNYVYSDLGLIMLGRMIEEVDGRRLDQYTYQNFYKPLGLQQMTFNPHQYITEGSVVPSEVDAYYRHQTIRAYVHDMGSAMFGGVAGHAGLFGNSRDVAVLFQMLLNGGYYGGRRYFQEETVELFTNRVPGNSRRGIGFDMKQLDPRKSLNMSELASTETFGHLGFTGIAVWADPQSQLIFVFLSNRTYPTMTNKKLIRGDYRPKIQSIAYRAIQQLQS